MTKKVQDIFGSAVFGDAIMRQKLPKDIYRSLKKTIEEGRDLDITVANVVAAAMKDWAIEHGATHYSHWFQPMTGITAEKHDAFITPSGDGGIITEFSGRELIRGEPDASSLPSGGLRATFEARGYTAWDPTSYAFIKDNVLCIPTAFCSYGGEALDKKTPLLRSMEAINDAALRILRLFGNTTVKRVVATVGPEQEYFLIRREDFFRRMDLVYTGRTLFGAKPPKGQELEDHYFGAIKPKVKAFMEELNMELWRLGVYAKTEHNETAPSQHELAPVFTTANIAVDHNQLTMELMKVVAARHGLACLLHEKPFEGINGSGKHNNWSLSTLDGQNLLEPGDTPRENAQFLLFLCAVIAAVDDYQDLLRISVASAGNDHRLGSSEAPPAIISMFIGDDLSAVLESIVSGADYECGCATAMQIGVHVLPAIPKDSTDRNRTSPFAFTGNKFEFRMPGSSSSVAGPVFILNTIVAEELCRFADYIESALADGEVFNAVISRLICEQIRSHNRIIFNGNNYSKDWEREAELRGLCNYKTTPDAMRHYADPKNVALFARHGIFTETELRSRCEILTLNYCRVIRIEATTMVEMANKDILPAAEKYMKVIADTARSKLLISEKLPVTVETKMLERLSTLTEALYDRTAVLSADLAKLVEIGGTFENAEFCRDVILPDMAALREVADELETLVGAEYWPYPTYGELLSRVD